MYTDAKIVYNQTMKYEIPLLFHGEGKGVVYGTALRADRKRDGRSVRKMGEQHRGELYTFVDTNIYNVQIAFDMIHKSSGLST